jgi:DNA-binding helix-hairpin-helix protein with protein kinase domain
VTCSLIPFKNEVGVPFSALRTEEFDSDPLSFQLALVRELVLAQPPHPLVGIEPAIAVPTAELHGNIRKKGLGPELHGDAGGDDHLVPETKKPAEPVLDWD